jgi:hypothetical protein
MDMKTWPFKPLDLTETPWRKAHGYYFLSRSIIAMVTWRKDISSSMFLFDGTFLIV